MNFKIEHRIGVKASAERIWSFIGDLSSWSQWNPVETDLEGRIAFGGRIVLTETIPGLPERRVSLGVGQWQPEAQLVLMEKRGLFFNVMRYFEIDALGPNSCVLANGLIFSGIRGEGYHEKHRRVIKPALVSIGEALQAISEQPEA